MKIAGSFCALGLTLLLGGCGDYYDKTEIDGPYILLAIDSPDNSFLAYDLGDDASIGRIPEDVYAAGFNADYIVIARHPFDEHLTKPSIKKEFYYLIRKLDGPYAEKKAVRGPFTEAAFSTEKRRLKLPEFSVWAWQAHYSD